MASQSSDDVEILVHITAPSRVADDDTYRRLAQAYLAFQPSQKLDLPPVKDFGSGNGEAVPTLQQSPDPGSSQHRGSGFHSQDAFDFDVANLSFRSALDNRSSPRIRVSRGAPALVDAIPASQGSQSASQNSWSALPSQIGDSYPLPDSGILHVSPTRVLQRYLGRTSSNVPRARSPSPHGSDISKEVATSLDLCIPSSIPHPELEQASQGQVHLDLDRVIPVTPHVAKPKKNDTLIEDEALHDVTHISSSFVSQQSAPSSFRSDSEPPPSKRHKTISQVAASLALVRSSSDNLQSRARMVDHIDDTLEIRPPSPPVGIGDIDHSTLVSEKLAKLSKDLSSRYRPSIKRDMDPFERGYWLLDCTTWSSETRLDTWVFLTNYLQSGLAGWGVWCRRDATRNWIRLYCWGHISKHTYLLLYLASGRHLKTTGATWIDGDGEVVVQVPPHDKQA